MTESEKEIKQEENVIVPVPGTTMKPSQSLSVSGLLYSKEEWKQKVEHNVMHRVTGDEFTALVKFAKDQYNIDRADLPDWIMPALRLRKEGQSLILGIKRFSERTLKIAPVFDAVLVSYDMRHSLTPAVKNDHGEVKDHYGPLDMWLRNRVLKLQTPVFVQLQKQEKDWRELIRQHDGKMVTVQCENDVLLVYFQARETPFTFYVKKIND